MTIEMIDNPLFLVIKDTLYCKVPGWGVLGGLHLKIVSLPLIFTFFYQRIVFFIKLHSVDEFAHETTYY